MVGDIYDSSSSDVAGLTVGSRRRSIDDGIHCHWILAWNYGWKNDYGTHANRKTRSKEDCLHLPTPYTAPVSPLLAHPIHRRIVRRNCSGGNLSWTDISMHNERVIQTHRRQRVTGCSSRNSGCIGKRRGCNCPLHNWFIGAK